MNKKSLEYWKTRNESEKDKRFKSADEVKEELFLIYDSTYSEIEKELNSFYVKFADDNKLSFTEAKKYLTPKQLDVFKSDIEYFREQYKTYNMQETEYYTYMNALAKRTKIQRLEALKFQISNKIVKLSEEEYVKLKDSMIVTYTKTAELGKEMYLARTGLNLFTSISESTIENTIKANWSGENFSDNIWTNKKKLITNLNKSINKGLIKGTNPNITAKQFNIDMNLELESSKSTCMYESKRIIRTETSYALNQANINVTDIAIKKGIKCRYRVLINAEACPVCQKYKNKIVQTEEAIVGINLPPYHPNGRDTFITEIKGIDYDLDYDFQSGL